MPLHQTYHFETNSAQRCGFAEATVEKTTTKVPQPKKAIEAALYQKEAAKGQVEDSTQIENLCEHLRKKVVEKSQQGSSIYESLTKNDLRNNLNTKHKRKDQQS